MVRMAGVVFELTASVHALPAMREVRNVSPAEDGKDDGAEEVDAVLRPTDDVNDGTKKVDAIPQLTDAEDDTEAVP